jgi:hypothetical protein
MTDSIPLGSLESSGAAKFSSMGDTHSGIIRSMTERQQTDPNTGQVKTFPDGNPRMVWVIILEKPNGDTAALWATNGNWTAKTGSGEAMLRAIGTAVREAGASSLDVGGHLAIAHTGLGEAKPGLNPPKLYTAQYKAPNTTIPVDMFSS